MVSTPLQWIPLKRVRNGPLAGLSTHQFVVALGLGAIVAAASIALGEFKVSWIVWVRSLTGAIAVLLAFTLGGNLRIGNLSRTAVRIGAVLLSMPVILLLMYVFQLAYLLFSNGLPTDETLNYRPYISGWIRMSVTALVVGGSAVLVYMLTESANESRQQALRFDLERKTLEAQALSARMRAMQARIEPHFLFNTLANVQQLVEQRSPRAAPLLGNLIAYLRAAVPQMRTDVTTLEREFDMARNYLAIMQMRMPDRLGWAADLPDALKTQPIPPLAVMTLVENAVRHGIDPTEHGGRVQVSATAENGCVRVQVSDTGNGAAVPVNDGFGLTHLRESMRTLWGADATLDIASQPRQGTWAVLKFPLAAAPAQEAAQ
jgi:sensor histidine kinase YesM